MTEVGCGFWTYQKLIDWDNLAYDGYDVVYGIVDHNTKFFGAQNICFHHMTDHIYPPGGDLLICKDVFQHLPTEDVVHYLQLFKERFSYLLIVNDILPDNNTNGPIPAGGYRTIRLEKPPFNEQYEIAAEWENPAFGVQYRKRACLLRGGRPLPS